MFACLSVVSSEMISEIISLERNARLQDSWYFLFGSVQFEGYLRFLSLVSSLR